jgi:signal transduction histidine kinase/CheY-like chemotaxis protein
MPAAFLKGRRGTRWLTPVVALGIASALLLVGLVLAAFNEQSYRHQKNNELAVQARILASIVTAALAFGDRDAAQEYVNALGANPEVRVAALYGEDGALFVAYRRQGSQSLPDVMKMRDDYTEEGRAVVLLPVTQGGEVLGTVYLRALFEPFYSRLARYAGVALLVTVAALLVAGLGVAHGALSRRAAELAQANAALQSQIQEREKAEEALRQAQKMETIGQLTGGIAHDFNNLLTIVLGNLERLRRRLANVPDGDELRRATDNAMQGAERAAALTRSLLAFSRRQPLDPKSVNVNRLVAEMSELLRRSLGEQVAIETVLAGGLWHTLADPNQLENAILNLAVNARDAMAGGGRLTIETANAHLDERYAAGERDVVAGQYVMVSVSDTGAGMTREVIEKAFDPFFTTKDVGHGTGLGLSQVYGFVRQSGGHIKIYSEVGEGTTVRIYLPRLVVEQPAPEPAREPAPAPVVKRDEMILVVEDEDGVREHSVSSLREMGYRVFQAADGAAALDVLAREPEIVLLFTDVGLPGGMNGRQLAAEAQRLRPQLKVLFTTGYARDALTHSGRLDPGVHLVTKPFSFADLAAALSKLLDMGGDSPRILLVEDEGMIRVAIVESLEELGFTVVEAANASQALREFGAGDKIDGVVVDLGLPDHRGDWLAAELRARRANVPIVIASGLAEADVRARFASDRLVGFLDKPYDIAGLARLLQTLGLGVPILEKEGA